MLPVSLYAGPPGRRGQTFILADGINVSYPVEDNLLVEGTDSVYVRGKLLDHSQYLLDYAGARIQFWTRWPASTPIVVTYWCLGAAGQPLVYRLHEPATAAPVQEAHEQVVARVDTAEPEPIGGLDLSGSKTLGVSFGGVEGGGIDQATHVTVTGELEGVQVEAELSDQSSPIAPEGTTRNIEELDKLLINVRGSGWRGSFGDVDLLVPAGGFGAVSRRAVGAIVSGSVGAAEAKVGYATPRGQFGQVTLSGADGSQGPYVLAPDGRSAQLVPGSEEVYLNGARMTRGWDEDYTIDYSSGELVFTNRHIIDRDVRIEARFQYATGAYERAGVAGGAAFRPGGADIGIELFREGDDPSQSLVEDLTPEQRDFLASVGRDTARAWLAGDTQVGPGRGDYVKEGEHFVYAGRDSGDFQVRFTLTGDSLGDYVYDDTLLAYRFVGAGLGNYVPRVRVALPEREELAYARVGYSRSGLSTRAEAAFQRHNLNLFAPTGAFDDVGAVNFDAGWQDSSYGIGFRRRFQGAGFQLPGSSPDVDFAYHWGGTSETERRLTDELTVRLSPFRFLDVKAEAGRLQQIDGLVKGRLAGSARLGPARYEGNRAGSTTQHKVGLNPQAGWFHPKAGWQSDASDEEQVRTWIGGADVVGGENWSTGAELRLSDRNEPDTAATGWARESRGRLAQVQGSWRSGQAVRLEALTAWQDRRFDRSQDEDWSQLLGSLKGAYTPRAGLSVQADFSQSYRRVQLRDEQFRFVGSGNGAYRRDSITGQFVPDPEGDYERLTVPTGRFAAAREWSLVSSVDASTFAPAGVTGSFSRTYAVTDSGPLSNQWRADARMVVHVLEPVLVPTLGVTGDYAIDRTLAATGRASRRQQGYIELYSDRLAEVQARSRLEVEHSDRQSNSLVLEYDETRWRAELLPVVGLRLKLELTAAYEHRWISEPAGYPELGRFALVAYTAGIARGLSLGNRTRVRGAVAVTFRRAGVSSLPFDVALSQSLGWNPSLSVDFQHGFSDALSAGIRYSFSDRLDRPSEHSLSSELKAYF